MFIYHKSTATHVKDKKPEIAKLAGGLADEYFEVRRWNYSSPSTKPQFRHVPAQEPQISQSSQGLTSKDKPETRPAQPHLTQNKKHIDRKFFDPQKGAQCFSCHEWGHKIKECPKNVGIVASSDDLTEDSWSTLEGKLGLHICTVLLDSRADTSVVAGDLVPEAALTGESIVIAGIHYIDKVVGKAYVRDR